MDVDPDDEFEATADLCMAACRAVLDHGTPEMKGAARLLLVALGRATAERLTDASARGRQGR